MVIITIIVTFFSYQYLTYRYFIGRDTVYATPMPTATCFTINIDAISLFWSSTLLSTRSRAEKYATPVNNYFIITLDINNQLFFYIASMLKISPITDNNQY